MADTAIEITAGTGTNVDTRTEATNGNHRQVVVIGDPSTNAGVAPVDATNGLAVDVKAAALPTGAATSAKQDTIIGHIDGLETSLSSLDTKAPALGQALAAGSIPVVLPAAQITTLTPPAAITGFATETTLGTAKDSLSILDDWDESDRAKVNPIVGQAGVQGNTGVVTALTQRVVLATDVALPAGTNAIGKLSANSGVDIGDVDVTSLPNVTLAAGTNTNEVVGDAAHDAAVAGNPVLTGAEARDTLGTAVSSGDAVRIVANRYGLLLVSAIPPTRISSNVTPVTATVTTAVAAPSSGNHLRIVRFHFSNAGSTACVVGIRDGAAGTVYYPTYLFQGSTITLDLNTSGVLDLTTATRMDLYLSAAGSVHYTVDYFTVVD